MDDHMLSQPSHLSGISGPFNCTHCIVNQKYALFLASLQLRSVV